MRNRVILLIIAVLIAFLYRIFVNICIRYEAMTKTEYKSYCRNHSFIQRWFFLEASKYCRNKYSRGEKRMINHQKHVSMYSGFTIILHATLSFLVASFGLWANGLISTKTCDVFFWIHFISFMLCLFPLYWIEGDRRRDYHRKRTH